MKNIIIVGGSGAIGAAFIKKLHELYINANLHIISRSKLNYDFDNIYHYQVDFDDDREIEKASIEIHKSNLIDMVIVATGMLSNNDIKPEKSVKDISISNFEHIYKVNVILPALIIKYFMPFMVKEKKSIFAVMSARVGSISDNYLGGWYAYRSSKAALNMIIKNAAIESYRKNKNAIIVGMHPGTVDSSLSKPFQSSTAKHKIFSPEYSVTKMLEVMNVLLITDSGKCFAWDGKEILP